MLTKKQKAIAVGGAVLILGSASAAAALWSAIGSGSGSSEALSAQSIVLAAGTGPADLYPGVSDGDLHFSATNPNPYPVTFTSFTVGSITSGDPVNCVVGNLSVDDSGPISVTIPAGATNVAGAIADVVTLAVAAPDGCQGVGFTFSLTLSGSQS